MLYYVVEKIDKDEIQFTSSAVEKLLNNLFQPYARLFNRLAKELEKYTPVIPGFRREQMKHKFDDYAWSNAEEAEPHFLLVCILGMCSLSAAVAAFFLVISTVGLVIEYLVKREADLRMVMFFGTIALVCFLIVFTGSMAKTLYIYCKEKKVDLRTVWNSWLDKKNQL